MLNTPIDGSNPELTPTFNDDNEFSQTQNSQTGASGSGDISDIDSRGTSQGGSSSGSTSRVRSLVNITQNMTNICLLLIHAIAHVHVYIII